MIKTCDLCNKPFPTAESWQNKCLICWKEENGYKLGKGDKAFAEMREALLIVRDEILDTRKVVAENERLKRALVAARKVPESTGGGQGLTPKQVGVLIRLCHPDRHNNSELSNKVTRWLLKRRKAHG